MTIFVQTKHQQKVYIKVPLSCYQELSIFNITTAVDTGKSNNNLNISILITCKN